MTRRDLTPPEPIPRDSLAYKDHHGTAPTTRDPSPAEICHTYARTPTGSPYRLW